MTFFWVDSTRAITRTVIDRYNLVLDLELGVDYILRVSEGRKLDILATTNLKCLYLYEVAQLHIRITDMYMFNRETEI